FAGGSLTDSSGATNNAQTVAFVVEGSTADLVSPVSGGTIGWTVLQRNYVDVRFVPGLGTALDVTSIYDTAPELEIWLADGSQLTVSADPLAADDPEAPAAGLFRYEFSGNLATGVAVVKFLDNSFRDSSSIGNVEESETFVIEKPVTSVVTFASGVTYLNSSLNSGASDLYPSGSRSVDVLFRPTQGASAPSSAPVLNFAGAGSGVTAGSGILVVTAAPAAELSVADGTTWASTLDAGSLPVEVAALFSGDLDLGDDVTVTALRPGSVWRVVDDASGEAYLLDAEVGTATTAFQVTVDDGSRAYRYALTGDFGLGTVQVSVADWQDSEGNQSGAYALDFVVREPSTSFFIELEGGVTLDLAGALPNGEKLLEIRGHVLFEALDSNGSAAGGLRFQLDFDGTFRVFYLGNLGSVAGRFVLDTTFPVDPLTGARLPDPDAVTVGGWLVDLGVPISSGDLNSAPFNIELPKLWGVVKLESNLEALKNLGIDLKLAGLLEINTTRSLKTETITLAGIPGDELRNTLAEVIRVNASTTLASELDGGNLPALISDAFTAAGRPLTAPRLTTIIEGVLWRINDEAPDPANPGKTLEHQYFIQLQDVSSLGSGTGSDLRFLLRTETQTFQLQPKTLLIGAFGQAIFRFPAYTNPEKTQMGPEWFRATGAFSLKISTNQFELFQDGLLRISPGGQKIFEIRSTSAMLIRIDGLETGFAGKYKLGANITLPGVLISGNLEAFVNTFGEDVDITVPSFLRPVVQMDSVRVFGRPPRVNEAYSPADVNSPLLVEDTSGTYAPHFTIGAAGDLELLDSITLTGRFRLAVSTSKLEVQAAVGTSIFFPGSSTPLFELSGSAAFAIDQDGVYGRAELSLKAGTPNELVPGSPLGFHLTASFLLEFNTAATQKSIQTFTFDSTTGAKSLQAITVGLAPSTLRLAAGGELAFSLSGGDPFSLRGRFEFTLSPSAFEILAEVVASSGTTTYGAARGGLRLDSQGLLGFIQITFGTPPAGSDLGEGGVDRIEGTGFEMALNLALYINTGGSTRSLGGVAIASGVRLDASGYLQFTLGGVAGFRIEGNLSLAVGPDGFDVHVDGLLLAVVDFDGAGGPNAPVTLLRLEALGDLEIRKLGTGSTVPYTIAGRLVLSVGSGSILNGNGFEFAASLSLEVNTTNQAVDLDPGVAGPELQAGVYVRVAASGLLGFGVNGTGFYLNGGFFLEVGTRGLIIAANALLEARVSNQKILGLNAVGALLIGQGGIAAKIQLTLGAGASASTSSFSFGGTFLFELNTTGQAITTVGTTTVNLAAGPYVRLFINGHLQFLLGGNSGFRLEGTFALQIGAGGLEVAADATLKAIVAGTTLLSLEADGALLINRSGIAARINIQASAGYSGSGFYFSGTFTLEINTTGQAISSIAGLAVSLPAGPYVKLSIAGSLELLGIITVQGSFTFQVDSTGLKVDINARLRLLGISASFVANAVISSSGLVLRTVLTLSTGPSMVPFRGIEISGTFMLELNTTSSNATVGGSLIPRQTLRVSVLNGRLNILGFVASGTIKISAGAGGFSIDVPASDPLQLTVGPLTVGIYGYVRPNGTFEFTAYGGFRVTAGPAYLEVNASLTLGSSRFRFFIEGSAGLKIAGVRIGVRVSAEIEISGNGLYARVRACVDLGLFDVCATVTFKIGTISPPGAVQAPPDPVLATRLSDGTLRLNTGPNAGARNSPDLASEANENYDVEQGSDAGGTFIKVSAFGFEQKYYGVSRIYADGGSGDDTLQIDDSVTVPAQLVGGDGADTLVYLGTGGVTMDGGVGNDVLLVAGGPGGTLIGGPDNDSVTGGTGNDTLVGGTGDDRLIGGAGQDLLTGGAGIDEVMGDLGDDILVWTSGDGLDTKLDGGGGLFDRVRITLTEGADLAQFNAPTSGNGFQLSAGGVLLRPINVERSDVYVGGGSDSVVVNDLGTSALANIFAFLGQDAAAETLEVNGTEVGDSFTIEVLTENIDAVNVDVLRVTRQGGVAIRFAQAQAALGSVTLNLNSRGGSDTVAVRQTPVGSLVRVDAGAGGDSITVGSGQATSSLNAIAGHLVVTGGEGADALVLQDFDTDGAETAFLEGGRIWGLDMPGSTATSNGVTHAGVEAVTLQLGTRADVVNVRSTLAGVTTTLQTGSGGANTLRVGSTVGTGLGGDLSGIAGRLNLTGTDAPDVVEIYDLDEGPDDVGFLTPTRLWGLDMPGSTESAAGITYTDIDELQLRLGNRADRFTVVGTHARATQLQTAGGNDRLAVNAISGATQVALGSGDDTILLGSRATVDSLLPSLANGIRALLTLDGGPGTDELRLDDSADSTGNAGGLSPTTVTGFFGAGGSVHYSDFTLLDLQLGSGHDTLTVTGTHGSSTFVATTVVKTAAGNDTVHIQSIAGPLAVLTGSGNDLVRVGSQTGLGDLISTASTLNEIRYPRLTIDAGEGAADQLRLFDLGDAVGVGGTLTANTVTGLGMTLGVSYLAFEDLALYLSSGNDQFYVESTHTGSTHIDLGPDLSPINLYLDRLYLNSIQGVTSLQGGSGRDNIRINFDQIGFQTFRNGVGAALTVDGGLGSDLIEIGLAGTGTADITVNDLAVASGDPALSGTDQLLLYGTNLADVFLFRPHTVAAVEVDADRQPLPAGHVERVRYFGTFGGQVTVFGRAGDDTFVLDDTSAPLVLRGDEGNDSFQVGQVFRSPRDGTNPRNGLEEESDYFETTLTTRGYLSNGVSHAATMFGGIGNDSFNVYRNKAEIYLFGEEDDDSFRIRAFVKVDPQDEKAPFTNINGGQGADFISFAVNAPVRIDGGDGFDSLTVVGTEFGDDFVVTAEGVYGAGLFVTYGGIEKLVVDALEGNDRFYISSTPENTVVELLGGLGSDIFNTGGNGGAPVMVVSRSFDGYSGLIEHTVQSIDALFHSIFVQDLSVKVADNDGAGVVVRLKQGPLRVFESGLALPGIVSAVYEVVLTRSPEESVSVTASPVVGRERDRKAGGKGVALNESESGITLLFDRTNWFLPQTVVVSAPADDLAEGRQFINIQHRVIQGGNAEDGGDYDLLAAPGVMVEVIDDDAADVVVIPTEGENFVTEHPSGHAPTDRYYLLLSRQPTGDVVLGVSTDGQIQVLGTDAGGTLRLTAQTWDDGLGFDVRAVNDTLAEGMHFSRIQYGIQSSLDSYLALGNADVLHGLAASVNGILTSRVNATVAGGQLTLTGPAFRLGEGLNTRVVSQSAAYDNLTVALEGPVTTGTQWTLTLDGVEYSVTAGTSEPLDSVISRLTTDLEAGGVYDATLQPRGSGLSDAILITRAAGGAFAASFAGTGLMTGQTSATHVAGAVVELTHAGAILDGQRWEVVFEGETLRYQAGANREIRQPATQDVRIADDERPSVVVTQTQGGTQVVEPTRLVVLGSGYVSTVASGTTGTSFVGDFGSSIIREIASHDSLFTAQNLDLARWGKGASPDIALPTTLAHLTVEATGNGETDFYKFTVTEGMLGADDALRLILDIDNGFDFGDSVFWVPLIRLYDGDGNVLDPGTPFSSPSQGGGGSSTFLDDYSEFTLTEAGDYYIEIDNWWTFGGLPSGSTYRLQVSVEDHLTDEFVFAPEPIAENEPGNNSGTGQNINDSSNWFTFYDPSIGNLQYNGSIDFLTPYARIQGGGNGSFDLYSFSITAEMLNPSALSSVTGSAATGPFFTKATLVLNGEVKVGDRWSLTLRDRTYTFEVTNATQASLGKVAEGLRDLLPARYAPSVAGSSLILTDAHGFNIGGVKQVAATAGTVIRSTVVSQTDGTAFPVQRADIQLAGSVAEGDRWTVTLSVYDPGTNSYVASVNPVDADADDGLAEVAAKLASRLQSAGFAVTLSAGATVLGVTATNRFQVEVSIAGRAPAGSMSVYVVPTSQSPAPTTAWSVVDFKPQGSIRPGEKWVLTLNGTEYEYTTVPSDGAAQVINGLIDDIGAAFTTQTVNGALRLSKAGTTLNVTYRVEASGKLEDTGVVPNATTRVITLSGTPRSGERWTVTLSAGVSAFHDVT
ncbi:MAG: calcium-binding protein, partial [Verrucomicrobiales bacterium]|nr:calcium-binding protein [Verrucomicrobiales bacterium]